MAKFVLKLSGTSRRTRSVPGSIAISLKTVSASYTLPNRTRLTPWAFRKPGDPGSLDFPEAKNSHATL